jgi:hypothetical protein
MCLGGTRTRDEDHQQSGHVRFFFFYSDSIIPSSSSWKEKKKKICGVIGARVSQIVANFRFGKSVWKSRWRSEGGHKRGAKGKLFIRNSKQGGERKGSCVYMRIVNQKKVVDSQEVERLHV